jgi:hypothetical protein
VTAADKTKVYGDANPDLTGTVTGVKNGDNVTGAYNTAATVTTGIGSYPITAKATGTDAVLANYNITEVSGKLIVTPAPLTVTADDKTKVFRAQNPVLTGKVVGTKNGDVLTANYTTTATVDSTVGSYPIVPSITGDAIGNYKLTLVNGNLKVVYGWDGFLQPINDTAHQVGVQQSKFKLGQTIPTKFVIKDAAGNVVQQATNPKFTVSDNRGACDITAALDTAPTVVPESGLQYSWTGTQYQYNWSTKGLTAGEYRVWANLSDGSTASYVDICLTK